MPVITAADLAKDASGRPLLTGVSFTLERGDRMVVAGANGAGKTTLLRMLAGEAAPERGALALGKGVRPVLHDQRPPRDRDRTVHDYVLSGCADALTAERELAVLEEAMAAGDHGPSVLDSYAAAQARLEQEGGYGWRGRAEDTARGVGLSADQLDRPLSTLSGGELTRASLARALAARTDLLLLDEPTNHLDLESLAWLECELSSLAAAVVLVAHDRWLLEAVGTSVLELDGGRGRFFAGPWHVWREEKSAREAAEGRAADRRAAEQERLERFVARFRYGTRARQAQSRLKRLERLEPAGARSGGGRELGFSFRPPPRSGRVVFELEDAVVQAGERTLLAGVELWLERGEHVSLVGPNGSGKTTLLEVLAGSRELSGGKLRRGHGLSVGHLSQHSDEQVGRGTVVEWLQRATGLRPNPARALLGRFLFGGEEADKPIADLSGGERRRLSLAMLVQSGANVLLLDEPTNHLDLPAREALEDALRAYEGAILLVSHDRALLDAVGTRTVAVQDKTLRSYAGGWAEQQRIQAEREAA